MNFKNICVILSILSLTLASPVEKHRKCKVVSKNNKTASLVDKDTQQKFVINEEPANDIDSKPKVLINEEPVDDNDSQPKVLTNDEEEITAPIDITDPIFEDINIDNMSEVEIPDSEECLTPECYELSKKILTSLDFSADPCNDFYQFTCGGWINEHENEENSDPFTESYHKTLDSLIDVMKGEYKVKESMNEEDQVYDKKTFDKLKNIYNSCMKVDDLEDSHPKSISKLVSQLKIKDTLKTVDGLTDLVIKLHDFLVPFLFVPYSEESLMEYDYSSKEPLTLKGCTVNESKSIYEHPKLLKEYKEIIQDILSNYYDLNENDTEIMINSIIEFEKQMISLSDDENEKPVETTIKELNDNYPYIDWKRYFTQLFESNGIQNDINDNTKVINTTPKCFDKLETFLQEVDNDVLSNYAEFGVYYSLMEFLMIANRSLMQNLKNDKTNLKNPFESNEDVLKKNNIINLKQSLHKIFKRSTEDDIGFDQEDIDFDELDISKEEFCVKVVDTEMGMALGKYYVENNFSENIKTVVENIIENIREAMYVRIPQMEWLDEPTRNYAIDKLSRIVDKIGYPDYILDPKLLYKKYEVLEIDHEDYFLNLINYVKYTYNHELLSVYGIPVIDDKEWISPTTINAFYYPLGNSMIFPAGILQSPFYYSNVPDYINYGAIGMVIGHELTHAFDSNGKQYDSDGRLNNWWTENDNEEFDDFSQCFIDQYNRFYVEDRDGIKHNISGEDTLDENLADNGGLSRSYEAWNISINKNPENAKKNNMLLPGLSDFTFDQLFYIAFGQLWCSKETPETAMSYLYDEHSPNKARVNGVVSNSKHFAKIFNCPNNTEMNPTDKCLIW